MKDNSPVYWKMRNGNLINVDDMDNNHVRNSFKMLLRNLQKLAEQKNSKPVKEKFTLKGDMAQEFHESYLSDEDDDRFDEEFN
jgi:hypothetical protein